MAATLTFLGAAGNVTGSRYLIDTGESKVLVDCGLYQERDLRTRNWEAFPVSPREIDAVLLTHAHLDHSGLLPKLCREGFRGAVHTTSATAEMARIVLEDSAKLQEEDAKKKQKRHEREGRQGPFPEQALYTIQDVERCNKLWRPTQYGRPVAVARDVEAVFENIGHVFGASMIRVTVGQGGERRTVLFSGDVGRQHMPILEDPGPIGRTDYLLTESTYGDRTHASDEKAVDELARVVNQTVQAGGNLIIPTFAIERAQDLLYHLNSLVLANRIPHLTTFLDSPMAIDVGEVFERHRNLYDREMSTLVAHGQSPFDWPLLRLTRTGADSKAINHIRGTVIVMAGSGMCTGGRIKHHLAHNISRRESTILFVGYQAVGTLGRQIVDGTGEVRILGEVFPVRARIERIDGFSAHADRDELAAWFRTASAPPRHTFVTHGEPEASGSLVNLIGSQFGWQASAPAYNDRVVLE